MIDMPTFEDVAAAAARIKPYTHETRVVGSRLLNKYLGVEVLIKCENQQRAGSFKSRGVFNAILARSERGLVSKDRGVVTYSSGNHGQAMALASYQLEIPAVVLMATDSPKVKVDMAKSYGIEVMMYDPEEDDRIAMAAEIAKERDWEVIPSFDDGELIAGHGTAVMELVREVGHLDDVVVPVGGGGLISGSALAAKVFNPNVKVWGVEPEAANDAQRSLEKGEIVTISSPMTIADGARVRHITELTFAIMKAKVDGIVSVPDDMIFTSMKLVADRLKLVAEPTGVLGLAGIKKLVADGRIERGSRVGVVLSGGNVDLDTFAACLAKPDDAIAQMQAWLA
ncbi:pyridoxal-phosphate dependent enzyme [Flaviflexus huanghaiensis]|uniref:pyridoxal-phosphate dependent enzyme n=1 Tax=Flaviflexus huanghaiensis TaxID=1111473 RepID=UPI0015FE5F67|nr:pyridoxal-phosphate dependent enzyme [Flaviflexus huanghaiensis]